MTDLPASALDALFEGDSDALRHLLDGDPSLATARWPSSEPPWDGYFHRPTLLHHTAGNPEVRPLPPNVLELMEILLDAGSEIDALTEDGPSQPGDVGWTTLGLVATSGLPSQEAQLELLFERGADLDRPNGGPIKGALYYGQTRAAEILAERGARLDLSVAAGLGLDEKVAEMLEDPDLERRPRLVHYGLVGLPDEPSRADLLVLALAHAALHDRLSTIDLLLDRGADPNRRPFWDHRATALHWAVIGDREAAAARLLERGADPAVRDESYDSTPHGWAAHLKKTRALRAFV